MEFFESSLKLYRLQELKMFKNFMNRSEQKTSACLSSNRKTCQLGAHFILKKITTNLYIPVGLVFRISGSHPQDPGSTPGLGNILIYFKSDLFFLLTITLN